MNDFICDNLSACHNPIVIKEDLNAMRVLCTNCKNQYIIRKDYIKDVPENRQYSQIFKKDILQGNDNLLYKYHPEFLKT